ncbi:iron complex outermembrane receptor protein [Inquilinus ginsengisoli]|uniref:TonB-dependent siderophore receptor n=1 Tax=Inquilinus ginsengisoli TaxID=363840 RepID=UPI003D21346C
MRHRPGPRACLLLGLLATTALAPRPILAQAETQGPVPAADTGTTLAPIVVQGSAETPTTEVRGFTATTSASATKTDTPLLETPQSISVITRGQLDARNVQTLQEALAYTPGILTGLYGFSPRLDQFWIRGFDAAYFGIFRDGLRQPTGQVFAGIRTEPYGLAAINVLRGPASANYGLSSPAGLVDLVTKRPPDQPLREAELQFGNHDRYQGQFDVGGPLDEENRFSWRLTGLFRDSDTQMPAVPDDRAYIAPALTWRPNEDTTVTFLGAYQKDKSGGSLFNHYSPATGLLDIRTADPAWNDLDMESVRAGYQIEHRVDDALTLRQSFRYAHVDANTRYVYITGLSDDGNTVFRRAGQDRESLDTVSVDNQAQLRFDTGPVQHTLLAGLDYTFADTTNIAGDGAAPDLDLTTQNYGKQHIDMPAVYARRSQQQDQLGVYLQDQVRLGGWLLTLSGRHDWVDTSTRERIAGTEQDVSDSAFSGRVGLTYVTDFGLAPYVAYATSFNPNLGTDFRGRAFEPTTAEQIEAGVKYQPEGLSSLITASVFQITQDKGLIADAGNINFKAQRGEIRVRGLELEGLADLGDGLSLQLAYTYLDPEVTEGTAATQGKDPSGIPNHIVSAWADYRVPDAVVPGLSLGAGLRYIGSSYRDDDNSTGRNEAVTLFDAAIRYDLSEIESRLDGVQLAVNATNLFDRDYSTCAQGYCYQGQGQTVIGSIRYRW